MIGGVQNIAKITELRQRILFTFAMLAVYRIGAFIVTPGIDPDVIKSFFEQMAGTVFGLFSLFSGGALEQLSIFSLGIMPYISASIFLRAPALTLCTRTTAPFGASPLPSSLTPSLPCLINPCDSSCPGSTVAPSPNTESAARLTMR